MWKAFLQSAKASFPLVAVLLSAFSSPSYGQQNIIANKDNTRPESNRQFDPPPARIAAFAASKFNGYNEIQWNAGGEESTARYIVEYSHDGVNFETAGQMVPSNGVYDLKHYTRDDRPLLYRLRMEVVSGKSYFSGNILLNGVDIPPVRIYPTVVTGNIINANAGFPVERIVIVSGSGQQLFAKDMNGVYDFMQITIPPLSKGWYLVTFYGNGWKSTAKFIIGG